ncbi:MAG: hypothetical protein M3P30_04750 [Chloroflexota bacterium]|nr:hypothetical protein [Chloroflexota bacterium]
MGLAVHIGVEIALAVVVLFSSMFFALGFKTDRMRKRLMQDQGLLDRYIQSMNERLPFSQQTVEMVKPRSGHWMTDLGAWSKAETQTKGLANTVTAAVALAVIGSSFWFLGPIYGLISLAVGVLLFMGTSASTEDVRQTVLVMAQIVFCWQRDEPESLRTFADDHAQGIKKLLSSVQRLAT